MTDPRELLKANPELRAAVNQMADGMAPEGVCEVCGDQDGTVSCPCFAQPLQQMCEHCHWTTCPDGGECA